MRARAAITCFLLLAAAGVSGSLLLGCGDSSDETDETVIQTDAPDPVTTGPTETGPTETGPTKTEPAPAVSKEAAACRKAFTPVLARLTVLGRGIFNKDYGDVRAQYKAASDAYPDKAELAGTSPDCLADVGFVARRAMIAFTLGSELALECYEKPLKCDVDSVTRQVRESHREGNDSVREAKENLAEIAG